MTSFLKISGAVFVLFAALLLSREYEGFSRRRIKLTEGFILMLESIRMRIDCFLTPGGELLSGFENDALSESGYLGAARERGISDAYFEYEGRLSLPADIKGLLSGIFKDFGREYREGTLRLLELGISSLQKRLDLMKSENEKSVKLVRTVSASAALGLVILLI